MKIGIITNLYPPYARGGAENVIVRTVEELVARGHDVFVITGQPRGSVERFTMDDASSERIYRFFPTNIYFTSHDYKYPKWLRLLWHVIDTLSLRSSGIIKQILRQESPDIVITHNLKGLGINVPLIIQRENIPHIHVLHDVQLLFPSGLLMFGRERLPWYVWPFYAVYRALCRRAMGRPELVISPSEYLRTMYLNYGFFEESETIVLRNPGPSYSMVQRDLSRASGLRLLFAGQLATHKGVMFLLEMFSQLPQDTTLLIIGDGPLRSTVEEYAAKDHRIRFLGYMTSQEIQKLFAIVHATVVPSLCYENSPTVIYESLSAGVPVLASRIGGVGELVTEGKTGELFTPGNKEDFLRAAQVINQKKEEYLKNTEEIAKSVIPYALPNYTDTFLQLIVKQVQKKRERRLA